jgi:hypothetical protein
VSRYFSLVAQPTLGFLGTLPLQSRRTTSAPDTVAYSYTILAEWHSQMQYSAACLHTSLELLLLLVVLTLRPPPRVLEH